MARTADAPGLHLKLQDTASQMLALFRHRPDDDSLDVPCQQPAKRRRITFSAGCGKRRQRPPCAATPCTAGPQASCHMGSKKALAAGVTNTPLAALVGGPYFTITSWLESIDLCHVDAACRLLHAQNSLPSGPWFVNGDRTFFGMELDTGTGFLAFDHEKTNLGDFSPASSGSSSWKARCKLFHDQAPSFSPPFSGPEIMSVEHPDEVAYCRCRIRADLLARRPDRGIYIEIEVLANADNLSLAIVDFEGGGRSSVTFSPETGAVLRERKVRESPRAIEGTYIHLLPAAPQGRKFEGSIGLYLAGGHLAFFRRWNGGIHLLENVPGNSSNTSPGVWESTGFCTDLKWAQGSRLSMCLAFRDDGAYHVRVAKISISPPLLPKASKEAYQEDTWSLLYGDDDHPLAI